MIAQSGEGSLDALGAAEGIGQRVLGFQGRGTNTFAFYEAPTMVCRWVNPDSSVLLAPSYSFPVQRIVSYNEDCDLFNAIATQDNFVRKVTWSNIKIESTPQCWVISCRPRNGESRMRAGTIDAGLAGSACKRILDGGYGASAAGVVGIAEHSADTARRYFRTHPVSAFSSCCYQDTLNPLGATDDLTQAVITFQINERSNLMASFNLRDLYKITKKNMQGRLRFSYEEWKRDCCFAVIKPEDVPCKPSNVYSSTTMTVTAQFKLNKKHNGAVMQTASLQFLYLDSLNLAPGASSLSSFLVNESQLGGARQMSNDAESKLEDMALR